VKRDGHFAGYLYGTECAWITKEKQKNAENTVPYKYLSKWSSPFYNYNNSNTNENPIENMSIVIKLQKIEKARLIV
jgi:hypothetical protein